MTVTEFLEQVYANEADVDGIDRGIDYIFDVMDDWLCEGRLDLCHEALTKVDQNKLGVDYILSFLTITNYGGLRHSHVHVPGRAEYLEKAWIRVTELCGPEKARKLLTGL